MDFAVQENHKVKKNVWSVLEPCREIKNVMEHKSDDKTIGMLRTVPSKLEKWENLKTDEDIQIIAFLRSVRILRRVLETWGYLLSIRL